MTPSDVRLAVISAAVDRWEHARPEGVPALSNVEHWELVQTISDAIKEAAPAEGSNAALEAAAKVAESWRSNRMLGEYDFNSTARHVTYNVAQAIRAFKTAAPTPAKQLCHAPAELIASGGSQYEPEKTSAGLCIHCRKGFYEHLTDYRMPPRMFCPTVAQPTPAEPPAQPTRATPLKRADEWLESRYPEVDFPIRRVLLQKWKIDPVQMLCEFAASEQPPAQGSAEQLPMDRYEVLMKTLCATGDLSMAESLELKGHFDYLQRQSAELERQLRERTCDMHQDTSVWHLEHLDNDGVWRPTAVHLERKEDFDLGWNREQYRVREYRRVLDATQQDAVRVIGNALCLRLTDALAEIGESHPSSYPTPFDERPFVIACRENIAAWEAALKETPQEPKR